MFKHRIINKNIVNPNLLKLHIPLSEYNNKTVINGRNTIQKILNGEDHRMLLVIGPCSIHDIEAATEYALRLNNLQKRVKHSIFIVMRVYFEKPRTIMGWKGLINDPYMDNSFAIQEGLHIARRLLINITEIGLSLATEALDPIIAQYIEDTISWFAIGARTTESQIHREMASGLSGPVGFKNGTDGNIQIAINAIKAVSHPHQFLNVNNNGKVAIISTIGNHYGHIVLRGGNGKPNYDNLNISITEKELKNANLPLNIMVDCSHANSNKNPGLQSIVVRNITEQIINGNCSIIGIMIESNINWGTQNINEYRKNLKYGVSVTDACIDWHTTEDIIIEMANKLEKVLKIRKRLINNQLF
ncbi:Phospho-2-dehydro-3-deoxyheptonate aldolase, Tyr-sensitive [Candidatus Johnevansia muelleri]|uniref:Phospho-2-dehydro-3-deoxyheptonate aldolase n=1 Tax=Candidatus Johnevansia muelleri TaxID=1495769 RepID=A0A078KEH3_9GAMM|nr:Phospho-2-dehydro-3-deoxyheptonate aldolase, Tyr-sensitive [Candidatus Evansia muelleri]